MVRQLLLGLTPIVWPFGRLAAARLCGARW